MTNLIKQSKMKKVITLCLFAFILILGSESVMAQSTPNKIEINAEASTKTEALRKYVKFDKDQRNEIYTALQAYGNQKATLNNGTTLSEESVARLEKELDDKVKEILTQDQYERYKAYMESN